LYLSINVVGIVYKL